LSTIYNNASPAIHELLTAVEQRGQNIIKVMA